ncbi:MAG: hypothetical protein WAZ77_09945 [Candidatus Nitrosopolaris sp.]
MNLPKVTEHFDMLISAGIADNNCSDILFPFEVVVVPALVLSIIPWAFRCFTNVLTEPSPRDNS